MRKILPNLLDCIVSNFRSRAVLQLEIIVLRHQLEVLQRTRPTRVRLTRLDRVFWLFLYRLWPRCLDAVVIVKPETVIAWQSFPGNVSIGSPLHPTEEINIELGVVIQRFHVVLYLGRYHSINGWADEYERWTRRDLSAKRYVYFWADGIYFRPRLDHDKQCLLVIIGADEVGNKDIVGLSDGYRESAQSWLELLLDLKRRGLMVPPELATGDGALGFWKALRQVYGQTAEQRCWVHKTANVLNKMPKSLQSKAKGHLQDIWMAETRSDAEKAFDFFQEAYGAKYDKAVDCLSKDRERLLTFYDFPAEHWKHLRSTNPIESAFATVRLRTTKTKGCLSRKTALAMVFKLLLSARRKWRRLDGSNHLTEVVQGVKFNDEIKQIQNAA